MPRKVIRTPAKVFASAREQTIVEEVPEDTIQEEEETIQEEVVTKPKKALSEAQLANLERAREAASAKKRQLKEEKDKANLLEHEKLKLKAMEYDQVKAKQQEMVNVPAQEMKPTKAKKMVKKVIEVEEEESDESEYEEVVVKKRVGRPRSQQQQPVQQEYSHLLYKSAQETIQNKIMEERAKNLVNQLMPRC